MATGMTHDFTVAYFKRSPKRYEFFASGENVMYGDKAQVKRFDSDPDYADSHLLLAKSLTAGDCWDEPSALWIADRLNRATNRGPYASAPIIDRTMG